MRWPWSHKQRTPPPAVVQARQAREEAERDLERVRAETPMYRALGESLRELREKNHFALAFEATFREDRR